MRALDSRLSRLARLTWPAAVVYQEGTGTYTLERPGVLPLGLGDDWPDARAGIRILARGVAP